MEQTTAAIATAPSSALLIGLLFAAAVGGGYLAHLFRIPRVVGYILAGAALKAALAAFPAAGAPDVSRLAELESAAGGLRPFTDLALGLILFSIGGVFEIRRLRRVARNVVRISLSESALTFGLVFAGVLAAGVLSGIDVAFTTLLTFALLLGLAGIATAPAATLLTLREYEAKGSVSDTILGVTGLNNAWCIIGFNVCFLLLAGAGVVGHSNLSAREVWLGLALTVAGSVLIGIAAGFVVSLVHARFQHTETLLFLVAVLSILGAGQTWLLAHWQVSYSFLLAAMCVGAVFANVAIDPDRLDSAIRTVARPLFVGFFVLAGFEFHLNDLFSLHWIGVAYVLGRMAGKVLGAWLGTRWAGPTTGLHWSFGSGLFCQAAVIIGLADFVKHHWLDEWAGPSFVTTVLGAVVIFEICGPLLLKRLVVRAGEVKAATLLTRSGFSHARSESLIRLSFAALLRMFGHRPGAKPRVDEGPLRARHLMRTNVECISAAASFDDVLHLIEQSRFNHFPVIDDHERLVGVLHFGDIRQIIYDPNICDLVTAADLSDGDARAAAMEMPLEELLDVFHDGDIGSLPVVENAESRRVVGIIEQRDVFRAVRATHASGRN